MPILGSGTSWSQRPFSARAFTSAFMRALWPERAGFGAWMVLRILAPPPPDEDT
jgi:hypothetical protein